MYAVDCQQGRWPRIRWGAKYWARAGMCLAVMWQLTFGSVAAIAESRVALVVGNASYEAKKLKNARNDAELMARTLKDAGFDVLTVLDGGAAEMRAAVTEFGRRLKVPDTVALFYYAGHGVQADGENYLVPLAADISDMTEVALNSVSLSDVLKTMARSESRMNIVILDACRDNPFAATTRAIAQGGLAPVVAPSGTLIGYATAPGQVARDGDGDNSPYSAALAANIAQAGQTLEEVFRNARRRVIETTLGRQVPWEHSSLVGEFFFRPKSAGPEGRDPRLDLTDGAVARLSEIDAWELIKLSKDPANFKAHMARFPGGLFAELASVRLSKLEAMRAQTPWSWIMTGSVERDAGGLAATSAFERAVQLEGAAQTPEDLRVVTAIYAEAAAQGLPQAMFALARAFDKGRGVARNLVEAARWYEVAAERNHAGAMAALGTMYEFGDGVRLDMVEALRLYQGAAQAGDPSGMTSLAYLYANGKGVARNTREARRLYSSAADKGNVRAMFNLALMDLRGEGGHADNANGVKLLESAAGRGHAGANLELAYLYDDGRGVARRPKQAAAHYIEALKASNREGRTLEVPARIWSFATRRELQRLLAAQGMYRGAIHGFFNAETRQALTAIAQK
jgi:uncharacterized protein